MVYFFSENYYKYHYSNTISTAFIFMVVLILFSILLPFFTNIGVLDKFWKPSMVYTDHPIVQFNDEFLLEISDLNGRSSKLYTTKRSDTEAILTSCSFENQDYSNKDVINVIKFKGHVSFIKPTENFEVREIKFFIFFDYYMTVDANIHLRSKAHVFYSSNNKFSKFISDGDLMLKQNKGLVETYFIQTEGASNFEDEIEEVSNDPFSRNDNYYFEYRKNNIFIQRGNANNGLDIEITFNIPYYEDIIVQLPNYTNLKNKWVLYSILFFPTVFVCYKLMEMVINNQIFKTRIKSDIPIKL